MCKLIEKKNKLFYGNFNFAFPVLYHLLLSD